MSFEMILVDAFTDTPYRGNPCAVCLLTEERSSEWMQTLASEMNLSETVFVSRLEDAWSLRYFTPTMEVALCGHATFSSAHVLFERDLADGDVRLHPAMSDAMRAARAGDRIEIVFPRIDPVECELPGPAIEALDLAPLWTGQSSTSDHKYLVEIESCAQLRTLTPDYGAMRTLEGTQGVVVTARSDEPGVDFESRFFAGPAGIDEDPVCGSAHCMLTPYWANRLSKSALQAYQCSARGGSIECHLEDDAVRLVAPCVTVSEGRLSERAGVDVLTHGAVV
ncbi:MAG: PhzF family phenazine biosynthesis protein [Phycisphaerales bacterium JB043]